MKAKKSWGDKLAFDHGLPVVKPIPARMIKRHGDGTIAIPSPREVAVVTQKGARFFVENFEEKLVPG